MSTSLQLLIDENFAAKPLIAKLRGAGHNVVTSIEALGTGAEDAALLEYAKSEKRAILTFDCDDFLALHEHDCGHFGILLVYQDGDSRDMTQGELTAAIDSVSAQNPQGIRGQIVILNHFRTPKSDDR